MVSARISSLEKIYASVVKLLESTTNEDVYQTVVNEATGLANAEYGSIILATKSEGLKLAFTTVPKKFQLKKYRKRGYLNKTFVSRKMQILSREDLQEAHPSFRTPLVKSIILVPLSFNRKPIGVLSLQTSHNTFSRKLRRILNLFGSIASIKIQNLTFTEEVQLALNARDLVISMASHEIKTPLTTVSGYAHLIERKHQTGGIIKTQWLTSLNSEIRRLSRLVNELLDIDYVKSGKLQYQMEEIKVLEFVKELEDEFKHAFPKRNITITTAKIDNGVKIFGDLDKLMQAFSNILVNAVKFSFEETSISFHTTRLGGNIVFRIKNFGKGIKKLDLQNIFDIYFKTNPKSPGMGLGLYISKSIIEDQGGEIRLESIPNKFTTAIVSIPEIKKI